MMHGFSPSINLVRDADQDIVFVLKAKCHVIATDLGCEVGALVLHARRRPGGDGAAIGS